MHCMVCVWVCVCVCLCVCVCGVCVCVCVVCVHVCVNNTHLLTVFFFFGHCIVMAYHGILCGNLEYHVGTIYIIYV